MEMSASSIYFKVKITKRLYKDFDSYHRKQKWILKKMIEVSREKYGMAKADKI